MNRFLARLLSAFLVGAFGFLAGIVTMTTPLEQQGCIGAAIAGDDLRCPCENHVAAFHSPSPWQWEWTEGVVLVRSEP